MLALQGFHNRFFQLAFPLSTMLKIEVHSLFFESVNYPLARQWRYDKPFISRKQIITWCQCSWEIKCGTAKGRSGFESGQILLANEKLKILFLRYKKFHATILFNYFPLQKVLLGMPQATRVIL